MGLDVTTFANALKVHYTNDRVENMVYQANPLLALMTKYEDFRGESLPIPVLWANPQARSASFSVAQARSTATNSQIGKFSLTRVTDYALATISTEVIKASKGNSNAFMEAATTEIDGAIHVLTRSLATKMYRSGFGAIGTIGGVSNAVVTLANINDIVNFEVGQVHVFSASESANTLRNTGGTTTLTVSAVDRSAGTVTYSANVSTITGTTTGDYIFCNGDREDSATPARLCVAGLEAWVPATAPTNTTFFGQDRSKDKTRLGGQRLVGTGKPIEEVLVDGAGVVAREGFGLSHYFISFDKYTALEKALGSKVHYVDIKVKPEVGFTGIRINGPKGPIDVVPDQNCPSDRIFGLTLPMWKLYSMGKAVEVIDEDGLQMLRQASADGVELRVGFYGNIGTRAPGANINIQV